MSEIKNIVFDLGGVLMDLDYNKTIDAFKELGYADFEKMYTQFTANNVFNGLETGDIPEHLFYEYMLKTADAKITKEQVTCAWNAMLLNFRTTGLEFLSQLSKDQQLYLLSNTNTIHKTAFDKNFRAQSGFASLDMLFTKTYYSHLVGMRKPNEDIFRFVLSDAGIIAKETLFIDDLHKNIETAGKLGFKTHQLLPGEKIEELDYF